MYLLVSLYKQFEGKRVPFSKIEAGTRQPEILIYQKIMEVLGENMMMKDEQGTVKEKCAAKAQDILRNSTDAQAVYLTKVLEYMSKNIDMISS